MNILCVDVYVYIYIYVFKCMYLKAITYMYVYVYLYSKQLHRNKQELWWLYNNFVKLNDNVSTCK